MKTFIQVTEIWTPSKDRSILEFHAGLYGPHKAFRALSERMCFGYDEGLPGKAWAARHPIILKDLEHSYFRRGEAARQAGLTCGVAIPVFAGDYLSAVLVFFCGDDEDHVGAIELWHNDPAKEADMGLADGYFGHAESFAWISQRTRFQPGFGLPGLVWQNGMPEVMADLGLAHRFVRRDDARRVGINKGLGLPSSYEAGQNYVMTFLSALGTPIARRFEIWAPTAERDALVFQGGDCDHQPDFAAAHATTRIPIGAGPVGRVWLTALPVVSASLADDTSPIAASAREAGLDALVAIPVLEAGRLKAVVCMYF
jgi:GAF domain-containing protein